MYVSEYVSVGVCGHICVSTHVYAGVHICVWTCIERPVFNLGEAIQKPSTLPFETGSLTGTLSLPIRLGWLGNESQILPASTS